MTISYQLYSSRNFPPLGDTLKMLASKGITHVEGFGGLYSDLSDVSSVRAAMDEAGVSMASTHMAVTAMEQTPDLVLSAAKTLGVSHIFAPHLTVEERPSDAAGWAAFGKRLAEAAKPFQDAGYAVGWHNHAFEFEAVDGEIPMDLILAGSDDLAFEFDVAWAVKAGADPIKWIDAYGPRIKVAHVKDIAPEGECADEDGWADVGHGFMDWGQLYAALKAADTQLYVLEHDNPSDHDRFATRSVATLKGLGA